MTRLQYFKVQVFRAEVEETNKSIRKDIQLALLEIQILNIIENLLPKRINSNSLWTTKNAEDGIENLLPKRINSNSLWTTKKNLLPKRINSNSLWTTKNAEDGIENLLPKRINSNSLWTTKNAEDGIENPLPKRINSNPLWTTKNAEDGIVAEDKKENAAIICINLILFGLLMHIYSILTTPDQIAIFREMFIPIFIIINALIYLLLFNAEDKKVAKDKKAMRINETREKLRNCILNSNTQYDTNQKLKKQYL